ncbi:MAG TPA: tetratricopeptide repeat protein, partial [Gemmataceae bacterium]|nr:tetratricopeptide repeat protein [Gemmataceae bacterium]
MATSLSIVPQDDSQDSGADDGIVERLLQQGLKAYRYGSYAEAVAQFSDALRHAPGEARLYAHRGEAWRMQCDFERAVADFSVALRMDPSDPTVLARRAAAHQGHGEY